MAYDLPKTPRSHRAELAIIVAPYFDLWFARRIIEHLKPRRIRFVVDDMVVLQHLQQSKVEIPQATSLVRAC